MPEPALPAPRSRRARPQGRALSRFGTANRPRRVRQGGPEPRGPPAIETAAPLSDPDRAFHARTGRAERSAMRSRILLLSLAALGLANAPASAQDASVIGKDTILPA